MKTQIKGAIALLMLLGTMGCLADGNDGDEGTPVTQPVTNPAKVVPADDALVAKLALSQISMVEGLEKAEKLAAKDGGGLATSAKFELTKDEAKNLMLSIYTVPEVRENRNVLAEKSTMIELAGRADADYFEFHKEVFADAEHLTRSAVHLAIRQQSKLSFADLIRKANTYVKGTPYHAKNPQIRDGVPVVDVLILGTDGKTYQVTLNVLTAEAI